jgi:hypothetical protein
MTVAAQIRDAIYSRLSTIAGYTTYRKVPVPQLQPEQLPALSIFVLNGRAVPDGDGNVGEPRLIWDDTIGISVCRGFEDPAMMEGTIDAEVDNILNLLLTDATFSTFGAGALWEALNSASRRWVFPQDGEAYFAELRLELTFRSRADYPPVVTANLTNVNIKTVFPVGANQQAIDGTLQVQASIDLPTG